MLTLRDSVFKELERSADQRGVTIQGLIRAVIVPEWHVEHATLIRKATTQSYSFSQDQPRKEPIAAQAWQKTGKTVGEDISTKIVA